MEAVVTDPRHRRRVAFDDEVVVEHAGRSFPARLRGLTVRGAYVVAPQRPLLGALVRLDFQLPALACIHRRSTIDAVVHFPGPDGFEIRFSHTGAVDRYALMEYVASARAAED